MPSFNAEDPKECWRYRRHDSRLAYKLSRPRVLFVGVLVSRPSAERWKRRIVSVYTLDVLAVTFLCASYIACDHFSNDRSERFVAVCLGTKQATLHLTARRWRSQLGFLMVLYFPWHTKAFRTAIENSRAVSILFSAQFTGPHRETPARYYSERVNSETIASKDWVKTFYCMRFFNGIKIQGA